MGRRLFTCLVLLALLSSVSAVQKLTSIKQLKKLDFGSSVPKHSLVLLHWFANTVDITNNDVIYLTFELGEYGSHHYGNYEGLLNALPQGNARYRYYTVGNLATQDGGSDFPNYVINPPHQFRAIGNQDRIIFRVRETNSRRQNQQIIDEVYLTQHYGRQHASTSYDPSFTYMITTNLLREIREFSLDGDQANTLSELRDDFQDDVSDNELRTINTTWGNLAALGLFLYIVIEKKHSVRKNNQPKKKKQQDYVVNIPDPTPYSQNNRVPARTPHSYINHVPDPTPYNYDQYIAAYLQQHVVRDSIEVNVTTGHHGKARITWQDVPNHRLQQHAMVALYKERELEPCFKKTIDSSEGFCDTSVPLNEGLYARLHQGRRVLCFWTVPEAEITRGPEFTSPESVAIAGYDAEMQLFVKDGKACARIFLPRSFRNWRSVFNQAWVGFYTSADQANDEYGFWKWQWVTKFTPINGNYLVQVLEYQSRLTIAPGVQARFIMDGEAKARSLCWQ